MRGVMSEASKFSCHWYLSFVIIRIFLVVMCASTPEKVELLQPPADAKPGDRVECEGYDCSSPDAQIKKELSDQILPGMSTNDKGEATFKGSLWKVGSSKGVVKSSTLVNVPVK